MCNPVHCVECTLCKIVFLTCDNSEHLCANCRMFTDKTNNNINNKDLFLHQIEQYLISILNDL